MNTKDDNWKIVQPGVTLRDSWYDISNLEQVPAITVLFKSFLMNTRN